MDQIDAGVSLVLSSSSTSSAVLQGEEARQAAVDDFMERAGDDDLDAAAVFVDAVAPLSSPEVPTLSAAKKKKLKKAQREQRRAALVEEVRQALAGELSEALFAEMAGLVLREATEAALAEARALEEAARKEAEVKKSLEAQSLVLTQLKNGTLPDAFRAQLLAALPDPVRSWMLAELVDGFHKFLQGRWECLFCMGDMEELVRSKMKEQGGALDTSEGLLNKVLNETPPVRYLSCCDTFVCAGCFDKYAGRYNGACPCNREHPFTLETTPVHRAVKLRLKYGCYEVKEEEDGDAAF